MRDLPIGVFDSGVGGLTVLGALQRQCPGRTSSIWATPRVCPMEPRLTPRSSATRSRPSLRWCSAASRPSSWPAILLPPQHYRRWHLHFRILPLLGVIEPGAAAAVAASKARRIAVIATEATVRGEAYQSAIHRLEPAANVTAIAATLFVALAEEGWVSGAVAESIARRYLGELFVHGATCLLRIPWCWDARTFLH